MCYPTIDECQTGVFMTSDQAYLDLENLIQSLQQRDPFGISAGERVCLLHSLTNGDPGRYQPLVTAVIETEYRANLLRAEIDRRLIESYGNVAAGDPPTDSLPLVWKLIEGLNDLRRRLTPPPGIPSIFKEEQ
jgi:hypothetical protein